MVDIRARPTIRIAIRASIRGADDVRAGSATCDAIVGVGATAEAAGLDAMFVARSRVLDPYVLLGAIAGTTERIGLGCLAAPVGERPTAMLAKVVTGLDVCSGGRAVLGITSEQVERPAAPALPGRRLLGVQPEASPRDVLLSEALEICRAMVRVEAPSFTGRAERIVDAWNEPHLNALPIALLVGARGAPVGHVERGLALAARFADVCVVDVGARGPSDRDPDRDAGTAGADLSDGAWLRARFAAACLDGGRPPGELPLLALCSPPAGGALSVAALVGRWGAFVDGVIVDIDPVALGADRCAELIGAIGTPAS